MAIRDNFELPGSAQALPLPDDPSAKFFLLFLSSIDPVTKQPWCSDVRASLPLLNSLFSAESSPEVHYVYVGQKAEFKDPTNFYRTNWNINNVPALVRYQRVDGEVKELGHLREEELLVEKRIQKLISE